MQITLTIFKKIVALLSTQKLSLDDGNVPSSFFNFEQREKINDLISAFISESVECAINADCSMHLKKGDQGVMFVKRVVNRLGWIFRNPIEMSAWSKEEVLDEIDRVNCRGLGDSLSCFVSELAFTQYIAMVWHTVWPSTALVPSLTRRGDISQMSAIQWNVRPAFRLTSPHLFFSDIGQWSTRRERHTTFRVKHE